MSDDGLICGAGTSPEIKVSFVELRRLGIGRVHRPSDRDPPWRSLPVETDHRKSLSVRSLAGERSGLGLTLSDPALLTSARTPSMLSLSSSARSGVYESDDMRRVERLVRSTERRVTRGRATLLSRVGMQVGGHAGDEGSEES